MIEKKEASGSSTAGLVVVTDLQLVNDQGNGSQLIEILPLGRIGPLELGVMSFQPRRIPSRELSLRLVPKNENEDALEAAIARLIGPSDQLRDHLEKTYFSAQEADPTLEGYTIGFAGWGIPADVRDQPPPSIQEAVPSDTGEATEIADSSPRPTITAIPREPWAEVPAGVVVTNEATLRIENIKNGEVSYLAIQLLSDGIALGLLNGVVVRPEPVPGPSTPTPPGPYPVPSWNKRSVYKRIDSSLADGRVTIRSCVIFSVSRVLTLEE